MHAVSYAARMRPRSIWCPLSFIFCSSSAYISSGSSAAGAGFACGTSGFIPVLASAGASCAAVVFTSFSAIILPSHCPFERAYKPRGFQIRLAVYRGAPSAVYAAARAP